MNVDALLTAHAAAADFLTTPAVEQLADHSPADSDDSNYPTYQRTQAGAVDHPAADEERILDFLASSTVAESLGRLAHYEVQEILGHGAFGIVLKAFDDKLHRLVAIKVMSPELAATSPPRKRFLREARATAAIRHEHVVAIHAVEEQPIPYLVMEYIPGQTLQQLLDEHGPLDVADVLRLGQEIASGLAAAHAQGLIHRDIKPANILLEGGLTGHVKITDFGLARAADDASLTQSGTIAGTPMYMSPEQAASGVIDQRSDLFSLGSVLYVMLSGRPPFRAATTLAVMKRVVEDTPRPVPEIIEDVPDWLCAIIHKLHAKQPDDRFSSASEVAGLLQRCLADVQASRPVQLPEGVPLSPETTSTMRESIRQGATHSKPRQKVAGRLPRWSSVAAIIVVLLVGLSLTEANGVTSLMKTVIRMTTGSGTLVIETDDPGISVTINGQEVGILGAGVEEFTLEPGDYQIAATKDGSSVSQQLVTITRGDREIVRVSMLSGEGDDDQAIDNAMNSDRRAAERALSLGGRIDVTVLGESFSRTLRKADGVPADPFFIDFIEVNNADDEFVTQLQGLLHLRALHLGGDSLTDAGLRHVTSVRSLQTLLLSDSSNVTDDTLLILGELKGVRTLHLHDLPITGAGLAHLTSCPWLEDIRLSFTSLVTDNDLEHLQRLPKLRNLHLEGRQFTDYGLSQLRGIKSLENLHLSYLSITDDGLKILRELPELKHLAIGNATITDAGLAEISNCNVLELVRLHDLTQITGSGIAQLEEVPRLSLSNCLIGDDDVGHLKGLAELRELDLTQTDVTESGIEELSQALPNCRIRWDGGVIDPVAE
ncbi:MAG: hypothetical protein DWQ34_11130 [Planctomycetota bacterium]|nr:MAG: hypothetical protein DWQ34_11130 [Planctomycetota bacterium]